MNARKRFLDCVGSWCYHHNNCCSWRGGLSGWRRQKTHEQELFCEQQPAIVRFEAFGNFPHLDPKYCCSFTPCFYRIAMSLNLIKIFNFQLHGCLFAMTAVVSGKMISQTQARVQARNTSCFWPESFALMRFKSSGKRKAMYCRSDRSSWWLISSSAESIDL